MRRLLSVTVLAVSLAGCHKFDRDQMTATLQRTVSAKAAPRYAADRWKTMQAIYSERQYAPIWLDKERPRQQAKDLIDALTSAENQGLRMRDYDLPGLRSALDQAYHEGKTTSQDLANLDLRLTSLFLDYGKDLLTGRLDPSAVDSGWYIKSRRSSVDSTLRAAIRQSDFKSMVQPLMPQQKEYGELVGWLEKYRELAQNGGWAPVTSARDTAALRSRLAATADLDGGGALADGVRRFQARHGREATGKVDAATLAALNVPIGTRIRELELNLERLRWLPSSFGDRYVLVNIPDFTLHAYDAGKEVLTMRVVVGDEYGHATPVFADTLSQVVFNPYWNVPSSIVKAEILPKMREDPHYLDTHHFEVVRQNSDEVLNPSSIDWKDVDTTKLDFGIRQKPGEDNALGRVKFMFPNQFNIYMHDTPARSLFAKNARSLSHGCVRLEHPDQFAEYVFSGDPAWTPDRLHEAMQSDSNRTVTVKRKLPVYIVYLTAFVRDGQLQFRDDLYGSDARAITRLGQPVADSGLDSARAALRKLLKS
jgi:murein L,D-transpeptidase YcbB/YkuD